MEERMISPGMLLSERYEIIDKVGSGGMADVYNAKDTRLNRNVAIKVLKQEYSNDAKFVSKFRVEAQSVAGLSHPNIVNVYDVGEDDTLYYIVMELVEGITLKRFIEKKGRLEINEAIGIGIQIAQGIEEAHKNNIIHRDIKPQNIIISKEGKVKVTDFGIAKAATSNTITSNAMGSVHYISPEQARGGYSDEKSDIYSLGVTLYEMLLGKVPFEGESTVTVAFAHVHEEAVPLEEVDPSIPRSLSRIVQKCMQKKPDMRYESAGALIMDLRRAVSDPDGDYVEINEPVNDSPTIMITDDVVRAVKEPPRNPPKREELLPEEEQMLNEDALDPKLERILKICSGVVAIIIVIVIILLVGKVAGWWGGGSDKDDKSVVSSQVNPSAVPSESSLPDKIIVPTLTGHTLEDAEKLLEDNGLKYRLEEVESDEEANMVLKQEPEAGEQVEENSYVTIYYSIRKSDVVIPTLLNHTVDEAKAELERLGLTVAGTSREYSDSVEKDKVCGTDPVVGTSVKKGTSVRIIISDGPKNEMVIVPNILGRKESVALERLADVGLKGNSENVSYAYSDKYKKDRVMAQSVKAGTKVDLGTVIDYTISLGPRPSESEEPTPSPTKAPTNVRYVGTVTISNPFDYEGESGVIKLVLSQDGKSRTVYEGTLGYEDFPRSFTINGWSDNNGTVTISRDDKILDGVSFNVEFKKVQ
ncbi:MAG TPA: Stk1 family PASTA domain-containing Ser/Thr kinase [Lachnospiraceae bacterium]|nr:Stk1 family PASTA domain-containing Ser/Thr kinase [Lachnospiraceae bacterium]